MRPPTVAESFYRYVAQELEEPSICDKISWTAESPGGFFSAASYERSECYTGIAEARRDPWLCLKVRRLGSVRVWEDQLTPREDWWSHRHRSLGRYFDLLLHRDGL